MNDISVEKSNFVNVVKALGIILVVLGHSGSPFTSFIYLFHVPLFFFISGYVYKDIYNRKPLILIKNRINTLYIPFVKYSVLFLIFHNVFVFMHFYEHAHFYQLQDYLHELINILTFGGTERLIGVFWFVTALFWVNIIYSMLGFSVRNVTYFKFSMLTTAILLFFIIGILLSEYAVRLPRVLDIAFVSLAFFYIGHIYRLFENRIPLNPLYSLFCIIFLFLNSLHNSISMVDRDYGNPLYFVLNACAGIYITLYLSKLLLHLNFLQFLGKRTFIILAFQFLSFKIINYIQVFMYYYPLSALGQHPVIELNAHQWWFIYFIVGLVFPLCIDWLIEKSSFVLQNKYIYNLC